MTKYRFLVLTFVVISFTASCGMLATPAKPYTSEKHGFSITFPAGSKEVIVQKPQYAANDNDAVYMTTYTNGVSRVKVINWHEYDKAGSVEADLIGAGANTDIPSDPDTKQSTTQ